MKRVLILASVLLAACSTTASVSSDGGEQPDSGRGLPLPDGGMSAPTDGGSWTFGAAFSTEAPPFPTATHSLAPTAFWGANTKPLPTNAAWEDFALDTGSLPINFYPYLIKTLGNGLQFSLPTRVVQENFILSIFNANFSFEATETLGQKTITAYDSLSVTVRWSGGTNGRLTAPLVMGSPYVTASYEALTPRLNTIHAITSVNENASSPQTADKFVIALNNGQTWALYASAPLQLAWTGSSLTAAAPFTGTLRIAGLPTGANALASLDAHRGAYPTGGDVVTTVAGDTATLRFRWKKAGTGTLLMATLPHHRAALESPQPSASSYESIRGPLTLVEGDEWVLREPLSSIQWSAPRPIAADKVAAVRAALAADAQVTPVAADPYFFGKQIAKLGRLALIADELGETGTAAEIRGRMKAALDPWLTGSNNRLKHETTWGGICSTAGLADQNADFGNGWYNDHHFHYGYFLYAAAALGKGDAEWLAQRKSALYALARDIANPSKSDPYFTVTRNKDWFAGHSWAAGLFPFADGRNQESSSEAVNAYYGLALLGAAYGDSNLANTGRVLLATEIRSVQTYWQIRSNGGIYPEPFASKKVVGVLWGNKVDHSTFFGNALEFIHGIQMIPFTPISEALLPAAWVAEEYPLLAPIAASATADWRALIYLDHAIIAKEQAWTELQGLTVFDDGNTKTNALYWVATRP